MQFLNKAQSSDKQVRRVRKKFDEMKGLSITSLLDALTIILVFLIKNVSMEAQKIAVPDNMKFPTTMYTDQLTETMGTTIVKMYPDRILIGQDNTYFGTPQELIADIKKRETIFEYLKIQSQLIEADETQSETCLLVQADESLETRYITAIVEVGTAAFYKNVYFSTLRDTEWLKNQSGQR